MKTVNVHMIENNTFDCSGWLVHSDEHYFFDAEEAKRQFDDCCVRDEVERRDGRKYAVCMAALTVRLPDDYEITTAAQLDEDLMNGDVESPDYDSRLCIYKNISIKFIKRECGLLCMMACLADEWDNSVVETF